METLIGFALRATANPALSLTTALEWEPLMLALALLVGAAALLILEFFIVSFGVLLALSLAALGGSIYFAFKASSAVGWIFVVATPVLAFYLTRWGIRRMRESKLVASHEITAEAGYHHRTDQLGIKPGETGVMVTPGHPSGRARFAGGECDVQAVSGALDADQRITVSRIEGPVVYVSAESNTDEPAE